MRRPAHSKRMAEATDRGGLCFVGQIAHTLNYQGWMDLARSVRNMLANSDDKCVNLSSNNVLYDRKTKTCRLFDDSEVKHGGDPIKLRWYPPCIWDDWDKICHNYDIIAALAVVEFIYGTSPFYHEDEAQFRANIRDQFRAVGPKNCRNLKARSEKIDFRNEDTRKAIWMLTYTFTGAAELRAGQGYLKTCERCNGQSERKIIKTWDYLSLRQMPVPKAHLDEYSSNTGTLSPSNTPGTSDSKGKIELRPRPSDDIVGADNPSPENSESDPESVIA